MSADESGWMGGRRPGRPPKNPGPFVLTYSEDVELTQAIDGKREWVGPGVAAYMLGISKDALKKRRQRNEGLIPVHRPARSNRQGVQYRWSSVRECRDAEWYQRSMMDERLRRTEDRLESAEKLLAEALAALRQAGIPGLEQKLPMALNDSDRLMGLAVFHPHRPARALTVLEALEIPWVSSEARQPFHDWAMDVLQSNAESVAKATD